MPSDSLLVGIATIALLILSLALHEAAHALVAHWRGDDTAKNLGRITLNPVKSIDPFLTIALPALLFFVLPRIAGTPPLIFGGAKPVPVVPANLKHPYRDMMWVALAGPATNFALAFLGMAVLKYLRLSDLIVEQGSAHQILVGFVYFNVLLTVFNLVPIPPLDGSRVMTWLLPDRLRGVYLALTPLGFPLLIALVFFIPGGQELLWSWMFDLYDWIDRVVVAAFQGLGLF